MSLLTGELTTLREEIDSVRSAASRVETRLIEQGRQWKVAQQDVAKESMALLTRINDENKNTKEQMQAEMASLTSKLRQEAEEMRNELQRHFTVLSLDLQKTRSEVSSFRAGLEQEANHRATVHEEVNLLREDMNAALTDQCTRIDNSVVDHRQLDHRLGSFSVALTDRSTRIETEMQELREQVNAQLQKSINDTSLLQCEVQAQVTPLKKSLEDEAVARTVLEGQCQHALSCFTQLQEALQSMHSQFKEELSAAVGSRREMSQEVQDELKRLRGVIANQDASCLAEVEEKHTGKIACRSAFPRAQVPSTATLTDVTVPIAPTGDGGGSMQLGIGSVVLSGTSSSPTASPPVIRHCEGSFVSSPQGPSARSKVISSETQSASAAMRASFVSRPMPDVPKAASAPTELQAAPSRMTTGPGMVTSASWAPPAVAVACKPTVDAAKLQSSRTRRSSLPGNVSAPTSQRLPAANIFPGMSYIASDVKQQMQTHSVHSKPGVLRQQSAPGLGVTWQR
jgi:hypothetical protein